MLLKCFFSRERAVYNNCFSNSCGLMCELVSKRRRFVSCLICDCSICCFPCGKVCVGDDLKKALYILKHVHISFLFLADCGSLMCFVLERSSLVVCLVCSAMKSKWTIFILSLVDILIYCDVRCSRLLSDWYRTLNFVRVFVNISYTFVWFLFMCEYVHLNRVPGIEYTSKLYDNKNANRFYSYHVYFMQFNILWLSMLITICIYPSLKNR